MTLAASPAMRGHLGARELLMAQKEKLALTSVVASGFMAEAAIYVRPTALADERIIDRVRLTAAKHGLDAIREEIGSVLEIDTHIEPAFAESGDVGCVEPAELAELVNSAHAAALDHPAIHDIHKLRARRSGGALFVTLHCRLVPEATLEAVHRAVDKFEKDLLRWLPEARRVIVHAEPLS